MNSYYAADATLRYYSRDSERTWREAPHLFLANMPISERSILKFNRTYGQIGGKWELKPEMRAILDKSPGATDEEKRVWETEKSRCFYVIGDAGIREVQDKQTLLRRAWTKNPSALTVLWLGGAMADLVDAGDPTSKIRVQPVVTRTGIELFAEDMWSFIRIAFLRDFLLGRTRVCSNPDCPARYFLEARKGQTYCTHKCAVLMNVRRFRERERLRARPKSKKHLRAKGLRPYKRSQAGRRRSAKPLH